VELGPDFSCQCGGGGGGCVVVVVAGGRVVVVVAALVVVVAALVVVVAALVVVVAALVVVVVDAKGTAPRIVVLVPGGIVVVVVGVVVVLVVVVDDESVEETLDFEDPSPSPLVAASGFDPEFPPPFIAAAAPPMTIAARTIATKMRPRLRFVGVAPVGGFSPGMITGATTRVGIDVGVDSGLEGVPPTTRVAFGSAEDSDTPLSWGAVARVGIVVGAGVASTIGMTTGIATRSVGRGSNPGSVEVCAIIPGANNSPNDAGLTGRSSGFLDKPKRIAVVRLAVMSGRSILGGGSAITRFMSAARPPSLLVPNGGRPVRS